MSGLIKGSIKLCKKNEKDFLTMNAIGKKWPVTFSSNKTVLLRDRKRRTVHASRLVMSKIQLKKICFLSPLSGSWVRGPPPWPWVRSPTWTFGWGAPPPDLTSGGKIWNYRDPRRTWYLVAKSGTTGDAPLDRQKYWKHYLPTLTCGR